MYWFSCPKGHEITEYKFGWYCKTCRKSYAKNRVVSLLAQTNKRMHLTGGTVPVRKHSSRL